MKGTPMNTPQEGQQTDSKVNRSAMAAARQAGVLAEGHAGHGCAQDDTSVKQADAPNVPSVEGAREAIAKRFPLDEFPLEAEALRQVEEQWEGYATADYPSYLLGASRALLALRPLADAEVAAAVSEAQAEVARERGHCRRFMAETERLRMDGDRLDRVRVALGRRAESAEAEVERLREGIRALADEWDRGDGPVMQKRHCAAVLRALLAPSPAAPTGEADRPEACRDPQGWWDEGTNEWCCGDGCSGDRFVTREPWPEPKPSDGPEFHADHAFWKVAQGAPPAPVSSGEAGTGEAVQSLYLGIGIDKARCAACAAYPDLPCAVHRDQPAPVVTPSAEGGQS